MLTGLSSVKLIQAFLYLMKEKAAIAQAKYIFSGEYYYIYKKCFVKAVVFIVFYISGVTPLPGLKGEEN
ncbi:hypothetical protein P4679_24475 [Priestia megaterium]|uniref:hypothetical protein n=1 Tax=Priestia megaterium TaxID=1404 RepID=UPI002E208F00|nr:hypothetical protein [Priestia megaterium]